MRDIEKLLFNIFVCVYELEPVVSIEPDGSRAIDSINNDEATTGFIVIRAKPSFDEIRHLSAYVASSALIQTINPQSADKNRRICTPPFGIGNTSLNPVFYTVKHTMSLNTVIGEGKRSKDYIRLATKNPAICFSQKLSVIINRIFIEKLI